MVLRSAVIMKTKRVPVTEEAKATVLTRIVGLIKRCVGFCTDKHRALEAENFFLLVPAISRSSIGVSKICILTSATIHIFDHTFKTQCTQNGQSFEFQIYITNWEAYIFFKILTTDRKTFTIWTQSFD